jgi:uncharacterized damage-inducible protein DinB
MQNNPQRPSATECMPYFLQYIDKVPSTENVYDFIEKVDLNLIDVLQKLSIEKHDYAYAQGKWTIKELMQHLIDCERIFCYRALCISRREAQNLPSFDEDDYVKYSNANSRSLHDIIDEFIYVRKSSTQFFKSLNDDAFEIQGTSNNNKLSVRAILFITAGHVQHHFNILQERYL